MPKRSKYIKALNGVSSTTSETLQGLAQSHPRHDPPSILIESAEGITTFPGLNGDAESKRARSFIQTRLNEIAEGN